MPFGVRAKAGTEISGTTNVEAADEEEEEEESAAGAGVD
jgi:hypothetical protein